MSDKSKIERARALRQGHSGAEKPFWSRVRNRQLGGWKFRRQVPLGRYIVDFYVDEVKAVVELDGDQHGEDMHQVRDAVRDRWLEQNGYAVKRLWNRDFFADVNAALDDVLFWLNHLNDENVE